MSITTRKNGTPELRENERRVNFMALMIQNTKEVGTAQGVKSLVYGPAGAGKTTLIASLPGPVLILSAEAGLLSLAGKNLDFVQIKTLGDLSEAYSFLISDEGKKYKSIALDSISEIAEVVLSKEKKESKDPRQAYGAMQDKVNDLVRAFRDIPQKHVFFIAKIEKTQDETGRILYSPSMPGTKLGQGLPFYFDLVLALRVEKDEEGNPVRALLTETDGLWQAKDRSGKLDRWERPDLGFIIKKIQGEVKKDV
jgi:phage nucleotide-binding protein